jgi:hypothetical protein
MAVLKARDGLVKVCATDGSFTTLGGVNSIDASGFYKTEPMVLTEMGNTAEKSAASGFSRASLTVSGVYDPAEAGMVIVLANLASCWVEYLPNGTTGWKCQMAWDLKVSPKAGSDAMTFTLTGTLCSGVAPTTV